MSRHKTPQDNTLVDYTLDRKGANAPTYMMDIREKANRHQHFGKGARGRDSMDDNDGGGASVVSSNEVQEKQP